MDYKHIPESAAKWALSKVGCAYSQNKRMQENIFDCSSLVARAYSSQGKKWRYGGEAPRSNQEVYDDDFELLWPDNYSEIGKSFGGTSVISLATQSGDIQFLCTDSNTARTNKITHVAMVVTRSQIVHARGTSYGVCTNSITHYSGKVCAIVRYNPVGILRIGMKGYRTVALQQRLIQLGFQLSVDGEYGLSTANAVKQYQKTNGLSQSGHADMKTLETLGLLPESRAHVSEDREDVYEALNHQAIRVIGATVNVRSGPSTCFPSTKIVKYDEEYELVDTSEWLLIKVDNELRWISKKYTEVIAKD